MSTQTKVTQAFAKVIESLRLQMFAKAMPGLGPLNAAFQQVDWAGSGVVSRLDFNDVLNYIGMFLTEQNITTVQKFFASNPNDVKITATLVRQGYLPVDISGDGLYQGADLVALFLSVGPAPAT